MVTVTLDLAAPPPWGDGSRFNVTLALHEGYGDDPAVAHAIVAAAVHSDDGWVRLFDREEELWTVPCEWLLGWRTQRDPSPGGGGSLADEDQPRPD